MKNQMKRGMIMSNVEYWDLEDYLEEIKFLMTEYDELTEEIILAWEDKTRKWVDNNIDGKNIRKRREDEILVIVKDENVFWDMALKYHNYYRKGNEDEYWENFSLIKAY